MMLHHTALGKARMDEFINRAGGTTAPVKKEKEGPKKRSTESEGHSASDDTIEARGRMELVGTYRAGFPDLTMRIDDLVVEGDNVVQFFTLTGTHEGDFMGIAATGKQMSVSGVVLSREQDEQIIEEWEIIDGLAMLQQLGVISVPIGQE